MDREQFLRLGILTEVALLVAAVLLNAVWPLPLDQNPLRTSTGLTTLGAVIVGTLFGLLMSGWFFVSWYSDFLPLKRIQEFVRDQLAPTLSGCRQWELIALAAFAGIGEEVLFRGVLQPRTGFLIATLLFGLAHPITPTYVIVATLLGGLLGGLQHYSGNLWAPIIAHAVYDYVGFLLVIREYRAETGQPPANDV
jgi:hypothetical protein